MACCSAHVKHFEKFLDFFEHNIGSSEHYKIGLYLMHIVQKANLRAPTVLCGVVAPCYDVDNKVPKLIALRRGNIQIRSCKMGNCIEKVKNHCYKPTISFSCDLGFV